MIFVLLVKATAWLIVLNCGRYLFWQKFADGKISCDDFGDEMMRIGEELNKQMEDGDGNIVIDAKCSSVAYYVYGK